jgi:WD repeat-containing protein 24
LSHDLVCRDSLWFSCLFVYCKILSASQDSTVRLWERRKVDQNAKVDSSEAQLQQQQKQQEQHQHHQQRFLSLSLFSAFHGSSAAERAGSTGTVNVGSGGGITKTSYSWHCRAMYEPKSEAVRDVQWSPFHEDVFAIVTAGGSLVVYNIHVRVRALVKIAAHSGDATTLSWHPSPRMSFVVATGGATDRCVKVWNLESYIDLRSSSFNKSESDGSGGGGGGNNNNNNNSNLTMNANTLTSRTDSVVSEGTSETDRSYHSIGVGNVLTIRSGSSLGLSSRHQSKPKSMMHVLSISSSVMRVRWRPPAWETFSGKDEDRHESMLAVATASIKGGASAGGSGRCELWSFHRPFMPLSIVEGHKEGAVTDFDWLETPTAPDQDRSTLSKSIQGGDKTLIDSNSSSSDSPIKLSSTDSIGRAARGGGKHSSDALAFRSGARLPTSSNSESDYGFVHERGDQETVDYNKQVGIWQHVLSVGRDGRCLIQSFARGDRPILRVAPSCFAITNLSPFQHGFGSLQVFSVCQQVPGPKQDFLLTGLRKDSATASAPCVFRELPSDADVQDYSSKWVAGNRLPLNSPTISFNIVDQGNLDADNKPLLQDGEHQQAIPIAPEVVHLSRFADQYKLYPALNTSRAQLCFYNGDVAESLQREGLAHMWRMVGFMLEKAGMDTLPAIDTEPRNAMHFLILHTIENLLQNLADEGDVQTCVALCEVLQVVESNETTRIPGLDINLTREWYLSYIDLLRDMCLFSEAALLIRSCKDPFLSALNQKGTTISESCPHCGKAIPADHRDISGSNARRACKSCRRRVAMCFICHEPVTGMVRCKTSPFSFSSLFHFPHFDTCLCLSALLHSKNQYVWCPGCGHGGHLEHGM